MWSSLIIQVLPQCPVTDRVKFWFAIASCPPLLAPEVAVGERGRERRSEVTIDSRFLARRRSSFVRQRRTTARPEASKTSEESEDGRLRRDYSAKGFREQAFNAQRPIRNGGTALWGEQSPQRPSLLHSAACRMQSCPTQIRINVRHDVANRRGSRQAAANCRLAACGPQRQNF